MTYVIDGDTVVVEGTSTGETADGTTWRPNGSPGGGRWCDVFEVHDGAIQRLFVYLDPDDAGRDTEQYPCSDARVGGVPKGRRRPRRRPRRHPAPTRL